MRRRAGAARLQAEPHEQIALLAHSKPDLLVVENHLWRAIRSRRNSRTLMRARIVMVTEAPANAELAGARRWEEFRERRSRCFCARTRERSGVHRVFVGHGRDVRKAAC